MVSESTNKALSCDTPLDIIFSFTPIETPYHNNPLSDQ